MPPIQAIREKVGENFPSIEVKVRYLNAEHFPDLKEWIENIPTEIYRTSKEPPLAIVLISDEAWLAYQHYYAQQFPEVPVFLCGVKPHTLSLDYFLGSEPLQESHVSLTSQLMKSYPSTGVLRQVNLKGTVELMQRVVKEMDRVVLFGDKRYYASYIRYLMQLESKQNRWNYAIDNIIVGDAPIDSVMEQLGHLSNTTGFLLSIWQDGSHGYSYNQENTYRWMSDKLQVPIFLTVDLGLESGSFFGGVFSDSYLYGEKTGNQLVTLLRGSSIHGIELETLSTDTPQVNWEVAEKFGIATHELPLNTFFRKMPAKLSEQIGAKEFFGSVTILLLALVALLNYRRLLKSRRNRAVVQHECDMKQVKIGSLQAKIEEFQGNQLEREVERDIFLANFELETTRALNTIYQKVEQRLIRSNNPQPVLALNEWKMEFIRLEDIANEVIDLVRMESSPAVVHLKQVNLAEVCEELVTSMRGRCEEGVALTFVNLDPLFTIQTDEVLLHKMIQALIAHSIRICHSGEILLSCRRVASDVKIELKHIGDFNNSVTDEERPTRYDGLTDEEINVGLSVLFARVLGSHIQAVIATEPTSCGGELYCVTLPVNYVQV